MHSETRQENSSCWHEVEVHILQRGAGGRPSRPLYVKVQDGSLRTISDTNRGTGSVFLLQESFQ
jgi:hypothetical protein